MQDGACKIIALSVFKNKRDSSLMWTKVGRKYTTNVVCFEVHRGFLKDVLQA